MSAAEGGGPRTILVAGASRGLGLGLAQRHLERGWRVIATVRTPSDALSALAEPAAGRLMIETLDITVPDMIDALAARLPDLLADAPIDVLFVNAGIAHDPAQTIGATPEDTFDRVLRTNVFGPMRVVEGLERFVPSPGGTIAVMSSGLGSITNADSGGYETYRASKAALNMLLRTVAVRRAASGRTFLAVDPGWVRTDMGGPGASLDVVSSTRGIADMLEARRNSGGAAFVTYQNEELPW